MIKIVYEFTNGRKLTKSEFIRWFQKKFLYTIRKFEMIKPKDVIGYYTQGCTPKNIQKNISTRGKSNELRDVVLQDLLEMFSEKAPIEIVKMPSRRVNKIADPSTLDVASNKIVYELFRGDISKLKEKPVQGKIIRPLYLFLDKEVLLYAQLKGLKFKVLKNKSTKLSDFIEGLESKHPELKHSIMNSYLEIFN